MKRSLIAPAASLLAAVLRRLHPLWQVAVEAPPAIRDPDRRRHTRLFSGLLVMILTVELIGLVFQLWLFPVNDANAARMVSAILTGIMLTLLIYLLNRLTAHYRPVSYFAVTIGLATIVTIALNAAPPQLEFAFLVFLPLFATLMFSLWETVVLCVVNVACLLLIAPNAPGIPTDFLKDLTVFVTLTQVFIVILAQQRNRLERERRQLSLAQTRTDLLMELITNLSHDFRTPLSLINTSAYFLERTEDGQKRQERIDQITRQTAWLSRILDDIFFLSRLEQRDDTSLEMLDLNRLLRTVGEQFRPVAGAKNLQMTIDLFPELPLILGHWDDLHRAVASLIDNAVRYSPPGSAVTLRTRLAGSQIVIEVVDTGVGINEEDVPRIFDLFFRGNRARTPDEGGAGLGLPIARRIVEMHRGSIEVQSQAGTGSTFRVLLPVVTSRK